MNFRQEIIKLARSEMAREAVEKRWGKLSPEERKRAVAPANEGRRRQAARKRRWLEQHERRMAIVRSLDLAMTNPSLLIKKIRGRKKKEV